MVEAWFMFRRGEGATVAVVMMRFSLFYFAFDVSG